VLFFVLIRKPTEAISVRPGDWMLAITATAAPLLMQPSDNLFPAIAPIAVGLWLVGNLLQVSAKLALFRSFGVAPANRGVKVSGPYRLVRHPMYAGYLLVHIGYMVLMTSWVNALIYTIGWWAQIKRLIAEERLLSEDVAYQAFKTTTRWRLIPGVF
jgi:protein-S-isoprenylcysteine O-methyltransferase Ste14